MSNLPADPNPRRSRREISAQSRDPNTIRTLFDRALVSWRLLLDNRVSFLTKLIPAAAIVYVVSPLDLLPAWLIAAAFPPATPIGVLDDVAIILLGLTLFIQAAPPDIVREHLRALSARRGEAPAPDYNDEDVVDGEIVD